MHVARWREILVFLFIGLCTLSCSLNIGSLGANPPGRHGISLSKLSLSNARSSPLLGVSATALVGTCLPFSVQTMDAASNPMNVPSSMAAALSQSGSGQYFSDSACQNSLTTAMISKGANSTTIYFRDTMAEQVTLTVATPGLSASSLTITFQPGQATQVAIVSGPLAVLSNNCVPYTVELQDQFGNSSPASTTATIAQSGSGSFYLDAACATLTTTVSFTSGTSDAIVYFSDSALETLQLTASAIGLDHGSISVQIVANGGGVLVFTAGVSYLSSNNCALYTVTTENSNTGVPSVVAGAMAVTLSGNDQGSFYSDSGCTLPISSTLVQAGKSNADFYFKTNVAQAYTLTTSATKYGTALFGVIVNLVVPDGNGGGGGGGSNPPGNATGFSATTAGAAQINLAWTAAGGSVVGYKLAYQSGATAPADCSTSGNLGNLTSYQLMSLSPNTQYSFRLCSYDANPTPDVSSGITATATTSVLVPDATSFTATATSTTQIHLTWTAAGGSAAGYKVAFQTGASAPADCSASTDVGNVTAYSATTLSAATQYSFRLCSYDANPAPDISSGVTATATTWTLPPPNATNFTATATSTTQIHLTWTAAGGSAAGYKVAFQTGASAPADCSASTDVGNVTAYSATSLSAATQYSFRLCSYDANPAPDLSSGVTATATTWTLPPPNATNFTAIAASSSQINLTWTAAGGSTTGYKVAFQTGASAPADCSASTDVGNVTAYSATTLSAATQYSFRLCSYDANPAPDLSSGVTATATTWTLPPPNATNFTAIAASSSQINLTWTAAGGSTTGYKVAFQTGASAPADCSASTDVGNVTAYSATTLSAATQYSFRLCSYDANPAPDLSSGVTATATTWTLPPPNATNFTAIAASSAQINLTWTAAGGSTTGYKVAFQTGASAPADCSSSTDVGNVTAYSATTLSAATQYSFRLCSYDANPAPDISSGVTTTATTSAGGGGGGGGGGVGTWSASTTTGAPSGRFWHSAVWTGSKMIIWGGATDGSNTPTATGGQYDPIANSWTATTTTGAPAATYGQTAVWTGSKMVVWGGEDNTHNPVNTGGRYDPIANSWTTTTTTGAPTGRWVHTAIWTGSKMIVWGGSGPINTGGQYDPKTDSWTATTTSGAPAGRYSHTAVWTGSKMIVWGGFGAPSAALDSGGQYDPSNDSWTSTNLTGAPAGRWNHSAVWTGSKMIVWGGWDSLTGPPTNYNTGGLYDPIADSWTATTTTGAPPAPSGNPLTAVWSGTQMIVWFGSGGLYDPTADSWATMDTTSQPSGTIDNTVIWTGSQMIAWGGSGITNTGGLYTPPASAQTNTWVANTTTSSAPTARYFHTAVWTGSKMIVWGGYNGTSYFDDGGLYDPIANSWSATTTTGAPAGREVHTAVWTGSKMIVWGGEGISGNLNDGGLYDPVANSWTATTTTGAPAVRDFQTAIWTGSKMIVWGGFDGVSAHLNTGGLYDPAANSWSATTTTGAPGGRLRHTAIWTGSKMIVWGGDSGSGYLNDGGLYDPVANSWSATTTTSAPAARIFPTAIWTGSKMIVWGGWGASPFNDGGLYDPVANSWAATTTTGAPSARGSHTAVWTGSKMIVWGGENFSGTLNDGGLYNPVANSWTAMAATGAPSARFVHTAVWTGAAGNGTNFTGNDGTGSQMIIWGGLSGTTAFDDGAVYSP